MIQPVQNRHAAGGKKFPYHTWHTARKLFLVQPHDSLIQVNVNYTITITADHTSIPINRTNRTQKITDDFSARSLKIPKWTIFRRKITIRVWLKSRLAS